MNAELKKMIHCAWYEACLTIARSKERSKENNASILIAFQTILREKITNYDNQGILSREEIALLNLFILGVKSCYNSRTSTVIIADLYLKALVHVALLIQTWRYETKKIPSHLLSTMRRKSIESDLTKILDKVMSNENPEVKDRFGFSIISYQNTNLEALYEYSEYFIGICTGVFYSEQQEFLKWILSNPSISEKERKQTIRIFNSNLFLRPRGELHGATEKFDRKKHPEIILPKKNQNFLFSYGFKDYIKTPKENSYQSLQGVFDISITLWDFIEELTGNDIIDFSDSCRIFSDIIEKDLKNVFPDLSETSVDTILKIAPMVRVSFPIEVHIKTKQMLDNPLASHSSHKSKTAELRAIFTLNKAELETIKKEAIKNGLDFRFYDEELYDSWGLHYPMFFNPEERIFYAE